MSKKDVYIAVIGITSILLLLSALVALVLFGFGQITESIAVKYAMLGVAGQMGVWAILALVSCIECGE